MRIKDKLTGASAARKNTFLGFSVISSKPTNLEQKISLTPKKQKLKCVAAYCRQVTSRE